MHRWVQFRARHIVVAIAIAIAIVVTIAIARRLPRVL